MRKGKAGLIVMICLMMLFTITGNVLAAVDYDCYDRDNTAYTTQVRSYAEEVLELVNEERAKRGIAPLKLMDELMEDAAIRAEEITIKMSHTRPNGEPCSSLIKQGKYTVGENIAGGAATPAEVVDLWMHSDGHRANILNVDYEELGVGYAYRENSTYKYYWGQMFKRPMSKAIRR